MLNIRSPVTFFLLLLLSFFSSHVHAAPKRGGKTAAAKGGATGATAATAQTLQQQANAQFPQGITQATDGSTILDSNVTVKCVLLAPHFEMDENKSLTDSTL